MALPFANLYPDQVKIVIGEEYCTVFVNGVKAGQFNQYELRVNFEEEEEEESEDNQNLGELVDCYYTHHPKG